MKKKHLLSCILASLLILATIPAVQAHTHIDLPNEECVNVPMPAYDPDIDSQAGNSHDGISTAKAVAPPLEGGLCD